MARFGTLPEKCVSVTGDINGMVNFAKKHTNVHTTGSGIPHMNNVYALWTTTGVVMHACLSQPALAISFGIPKLWNVPARLDINSMEIHAFCAQMAKYGINQNFHVSVLRDPSRIFWEFVWSSSSALVGWSGFRICGFADVRALQFGMVITVLLTLAIMGESGTKSINPANVLERKSGWMKHVSLLESPAQMEESGILQFMLVSARQEPIQKLLTVFPFQSVETEKLITLSPTNVTAPSGLSREDILVLIHHVQLVNIGMATNVQSYHVLLLPIFTKIVVCSEVQTPAILAISGMEINAPIILIPAHQVQLGEVSHVSPMALVTVDFISIRMAHVLPYPSNALLQPLGMGNLVELQAISAQKELIITLIIENVYHIHHVQMATFGIQHTSDVSAPPARSAQEKPASTVLAQNNGIQFKGASAPMVPLILDSSVRLSRRINAV